MMMVVGGGIFPLLQQFISDAVGYMASYQTDFPDLTGWLNQNNNSGKKASDNKAKKDAEAGTTPKNGPYIGSSFGNYWKGKIEGGK